MKKMMMKMHSYNQIRSSAAKAVIVLVLFSGYFFFSAIAEAASLSLTPGTGVYTAGQTFTARVVVNTEGQQINAAEGTLSFNPNELSVIGVQRGSIFSLWTADPSFSNSAGTITFSGGTPSGYRGSAGTVLTISFRVKNAGNPRVTFSNGAVLAADGRGTNVLTAMNGASYTIAAQEVVPEPETIEYIAPANTPGRPEISSETHAEPEGWHRSNEAVLTWTLPSDVTAVRTLLDENSGSIPTRVYDTPIDSITLSDLEEGVQYFHLQFQNADGWGRVAHYRLAVDTQNPTKLDLALPEDADLSNPVQTLVTNVEDETSSVTRYFIQVDNGEPYEFIDTNASGTITLNALEPGYHTIVVEAFDEAGNSIVDSFSFEISAFEAPRLTEAPSQISEDVIPVIKGETRPNAEVEVTVTKLGADAQTYSVTSDANGVFTFIPEGRFSDGVYELSVVATDTYGARSEVSETVRIAVQEPGLVRFGSLAVSYLSVLVPLIGLVLLGWLIFLFFVVRLRRLRGGVMRESTEALSILHAEFSTLRSALREQSETLRAARKTKKLTKAEAALVAELEERLAASEASVAKEIEDVEDIVE